MTDRNFRSLFFDKMPPNRKPNLCAAPYRLLFPIFSHFFFSFFLFTHSFFPKFKANEQIQKSLMRSSAYESEIKCQMEEINRKNNFIWTRRMIDVYDDINYIFHLFRPSSSSSSSTWQTISFGDFVVFLCERRQRCQ